MRPTAKYLLLSCTSGVLWGLLVLAGGFLTAVPEFILGGLIASPFIGLLVGLASRRWTRLGAGLRMIAALVSLYASVALFGLSIGIYGWLVAGNDVELVFGFPFLYLWVVTFTGYFLLFWPLAYLNHHLLGPLARAG